MTDARNEDPRMGKIQKSLMLNEDLVRLIDAHQKATGASFTRILTAAILAYFFQDPERPNPGWMKRAVELESGEITVGDMPTQRAQEVGGEALAEIGPFEPKIEKIPQWARHREFQWRRMIASGDEDPVQKIIDCRATPWK